MKVPRNAQGITESQLWFAERQSTGFLVALWLDEATSAKLALESGEPANNLHITLAYCGEAADMDELQQARLITAIADAVRYTDPLTGKIAGYGRFVGSETSDGNDVFYATPDIPRLVELRQSLINRLWDHGVTVNADHGYNPHITLAYIASGGENPVDSVEDIDLKFDAVTIMAGERRIDIPFWKPEPSVSMYSDQVDVPLEAPLGSQPVRPLYFGSFDKEWIPFLPKPGSYIHESYGTMDLSSEAYDEMLRNFNDYVYKQDLPIRATHTPQDSGAVGWIKPGGMRVASDGSLEVKPEWNELGKGLVEDDRFRYVSAEFCKVWTNPVTQEKHQNVAVGLALVTRPHFKTDVLNPLSASEALAFAEASTSGDAGEGNPMPEDQNPTPPVVDTPPTTTTTTTTTPPAAPPPDPAATPAQLGQVVLSDLQTVVLTAKQRQDERQLFSDLTTKVELAERDRDRAKAELAELRRTQRHEKFTAEVLGRSSENGVQWFGDIQANVNHLVSLAEQFGDESTEIKYAIMQKRNEAQAIRNTGIFDPISLGSTDEIATTTVQVNRLAEIVKQAHPELSEEQAITKVYEENPDLYLRSLKPRG